MMHENRRRERDMKNDSQKSPEAAPSPQSVNNTDRNVVSDRRSRQSQEIAEINMLRENDLYERQDS
jgi:hypothetical protein